MSLSEYRYRDATYNMWTGGVLENGTWHWGNPNLTWIPWNSGRGQPSNNVYHTHIAITTPYNGRYLFTAPGGYIHAPLCEQSPESMSLGM